MFKNTGNQFFSLFILSFFLTISCESQKKEKSMPEVTDDHKKRFAPSRLLEGKVFSSRSGNRLGMDSDTEILFQADQKATLIESGLDSVRFEGIFVVDKQTDEIELKLPKYKKVWPKMKLEIRDGRTLIFRSDGHTYMTSELQDAKGFENFWPFAEATTR